MREKHFMCDIETTDTIPKHGDILQIAFLETDFVDGFWRPGRHLNKLLHTDMEPETQFAKDNMAALFAKCQKIPYQTPGEIREEILSFFRECGGRMPYVYLMGWNVTMLDIPFLLEHENLELFYRQTINGMEIATGDFHYRVYEQSGSISLAQCVLFEEGRNELVQRAFEAYPEISMPEGKEHDALYDCYKQLRVENGLIRLLRQGASALHPSQFNFGASEQAS